MHREPGCSSEPHSRWTSYGCHRCLQDTSMTTRWDAVRQAAVAALDPDEYAAAIPTLAALLVDAVEGGAAVNFVAGVTEEQAAEWWRERIPQVADGTITAFVARSPAAQAVGR